MQTSVVRTNCMDCLDRTNVVQSTLGRWVLNRQLRDVGILQSTEVIENDEQFMQIFKNSKFLIVSSGFRANYANNQLNIVWADNADSLSIPYSGTGALKTDFTRTGKRTRTGLINDFNNSAFRYIKNNYLDGSRQDGIDLILGKYKVTPTSSSPFKTTPSSWMIKLVPLYFLVSFVIFMMILFGPELFSIESSLVYISCLSVAFAIVVTCWLFIQQNGYEFVDWPKLLPISPHLLQQQEEELILAPPSMEQAVHKATEMIQKWTTRRNSTAVLNEVEQGYELLPTTLKKTT